MKILKFFLYFVLPVYLVVLYFLFGSSLVRYGFNHYFGTSVTLTGVEITPQLQLNINKVDFDFSDSLGRFNQAGSVRAIKFRLSDLVSKQAAYLSTGPANIGSFGQFKNAVVSIQNKGLFNFKYQFFNIAISDLVVSDGLYSAQFEMEGGLELLENKIAASSFTVTNLKSKNTKLLEVERMGGRINEFNFSKPISEQSNLVSLKADRILGFQPNFDIEFLSMEIFNKLGELKTAGSVKSIELDQKKVHSEEFNFEFRLQGIVDSYEPAEATFRAKNTTFLSLT